MASKVVQLVFVVLGAIGLMGAIICCALPEWIVGHSEDMEVHIGLWKVCPKHSSGLQICGTRNTYESSEFHAFRALTVISCMLGVLSLLLMFFGSDFTPYVQNQDNKSKMILAAGVGLMLAGLLLITPVSWISYDFRNGIEGIKLGASVYIGFLSGLMLMLIGGGLCYVIRSGSSSSGAIISIFSNRA
ncbi:claudin-9-like [Poeciliopsis prolifica]|uniref:claudin-9-like n=1 Tax=Poeciliopsis prolifica TaxID=188132 RepID=UPI0024131BB4|nr:claudin-9-like [Poeciliopsis prolifica]